jgi:hypothetical protein
MAKKKTSTPGKKLRYKAYQAQSREQKNRVLKLARHIKNHPNDAQSAEAINNKNPKHRKKPTGRKVHRTNFGTQEVGEGVFSYIPEGEFKPGHPVLKLCKSGYVFDQQKKFKFSAVIGEDFKAHYGI